MPLTYFNLWYSVQYGASLGSFPACGVLCVIAAAV